MEDTVSIIQKIQDKSSGGIEDYASSIENWLTEDAYGIRIDCEEKKKFLRQIFRNSKVVLICGPAGTGKSTMINHISKYFNDRSKLYLTHTNSANDNLKRKVTANKGTFKTIKKFLSQEKSDTEFDVLIIDECSIVSNSDMLKVLDKASFELLVLVGDIFQIESIRFGNWFDVCKDIISNTSVFELTRPYRSSNHKLLETWKMVRNLEDDILEHITKNEYSVRLDDSIFDHSEDDEIILCLNYDGLYGINNINKFLQENNKNISVQLGIHTYKINDPILFNESANDMGRYGSLIYNNLKGRIVGIENSEDRIQFDIEIDKILTESDVSWYSLELVGNTNDRNSIIRLFVSKYESTDEDDDSSSNTIVPFQIAYAVSIHKAQGSECKSVKVVITDEVEGMITHNIIYTAITRAKEKLKIYWSPETESKIIKKLKKRDIQRDLALLKSGYLMENQGG